MSAVYQVEAAHTNDQHKVSNTENVDATNGASAKQMPIHDFPEICTGLVSHALPTTNTTFYFLPSRGGVDGVEDDTSDAHTSTRKDKDKDTNNTKKNTDNSNAQSPTASNRISANTTGTTGLLGELQIERLTVMVERAVREGFNCHIIEYAPYVFTVHRDNIV